MNITLDLAFAHRVFLFEVCSKKEKTKIVDIIDTMIFPSVCEIIVECIKQNPFVLAYDKKTYIFTYTRM
jgi:hypothetical protein